MIQKGQIQGCDSETSISPQLLHFDGVAMPK